MQIENGSYIVGILDTMGMKEAADQRYNEVLNMPGYQRMDGFSIGVIESLVASRSLERALAYGRELDFADPDMAYTAIPLTALAVLFNGEGKYAESEEATALAARALLKYNEWDFKNAGAGPFQSLRDIKSDLPFF